MRKVVLGFLSRDGAEDLEYQVGGKVGIKTKLTEDVTRLQWLKTTVVMTGTSMMLNCQ